MQYPVSTYLRAGMFFTLYGLVKYLPPPVGDICRYAVLKIFTAAIHSWKVKDGVSVWFPEGVRIGRNVTINEQVFLDGYGGLEIGDDCRIAHGCSFISEDHIFEDPDTPIWQQGKRAGAIVLEQDVWLGCGVRVLRGVRIGRGSVIGAGAVVTSDVPPYSIAIGLPARVVGKRGTRGARS